MAPSCGATVVDCTTASHWAGAHALEADGTLDILHCDHTAATWERVAPPWTATPTPILSFPGASSWTYLPRVVTAPLGGRIFVRGPAGSLVDALYDIDPAGANLVSFGAMPLDHVDFAATFAGTTPYLLAGRYEQSGKLTLSFLRGPSAAGTGWVPLGSYGAMLPQPLPVGANNAPVQGQPIALVQEANGDLVGFELTAGLAVLSASGTLTQPVVTLPHTPIDSVTATLSPSGQAIVYLLADDTSVTPVRMRIDRIVHSGTSWTVETLPVQAPWTVDSFNRMNSEIAAYDPTHLMVLEATIGDTTGYALYSITQATDGTWPLAVPCTDPHCDNANRQQVGFTRLAIAPGPIYAVNGGNPDPNSADFNGDVQVVSQTTTGWSAAYPGPESEATVNPCETTQGCSVAPGSHHDFPWALAVVAACAAALVRRRRPARRQEPG
jgi:MYXO-CTERM domain-containing protein